MRNYLSFALLLLTVYILFSNVSAYRSFDKLPQVVDGVSQELKHEIVKTRIPPEKINSAYVENHSVYDMIFWFILTTFIVYVVYIRMRTNFRIDYPDEDTSAICSALISYRKAINTDPYLDPDVRERHLMSQFNSGPLIAICILWFGVGFSSLDEIFGVTFKHIEDLVGLLMALFIYFVNIIGCCIVFDICVAAPMKYYENS